MRRFRCPHTHPTTGEAVYLCCTCPRVAPGGCYPLSLPCGARTFLTGGPFAPPARLSSLLPDYFTGKMGGCQFQDFLAPNFEKFSLTKAESCDTMPLQQRGVVGAPVQGARYQSTSMCGP